MKLFVFGLGFDENAAALLEKLIEEAKTNLNNRAKAKNCLMLSKPFDTRESCSEPDRAFVLKPTVNGSKSAFH
jgi:hypothetical protein